MRRRLFAVASAISLLLCAAVVVMWAWSHSGCAQGVIQRGRTRNLTFGVGVDVLYAEYWTQDIGGDTDIPGWSHSFHRDAYPDPFSTWVKGPWPPVVVVPDLAPEYGFARHRIFVVMWLPAMLFALLPLTWISVRIRRRRMASGRCSKCGYSLL
jgi:hypothetical protein